MAEERLVRARLGYRLAKRLLAWPWAVRQAWLARWMENQMARQARLGDREAQSFYGHRLLFRGQGFAAQLEGLRLLELAAKAGDAKAAYQLGVQALKGSVQKPSNASQAAEWWGQSLNAGHPLAAGALSRLYQDGGPGIQADPEKAAFYEKMSGF